MRLRAARRLRGAPCWPGCATNMAGSRSSGSFPVQASPRSAPLCPEAGGGACFCGRQGLVGGGDFRRRSPGACRARSFFLLPRRLRRRCRPDPWRRGHRPRRRLVAAHAPFCPRSGFAEALADKGRYEAMMADLPVWLLDHPQPGLFGAAAAFAAQEGLTAGLRILICPS